jgi:hypothetical protein
MALRADPASLRADRSGRRRVLLAVFTVAALLLGLVGMHSLFASTTVGGQAANSSSFTQVHNSIRSPESTRLAIVTMAERGTGAGLQHRHV